MLLECCLKGHLNKLSGGICKQMFLGWSHDANVRVQQPMGEQVLTQIPPPFAGQSLIITQMDW